MHVFIHQSLLSHNPIFLCPRIELETAVESKLLQDTCTEWDFWSFAEVTQTLNLQKSLLLFALTPQDNNVNLTTLHGLILFSQISPEEVELLYLYVKPTSRKQNVAHNLLKTSIDLFRKHTPINHIHLEYGSMNASASRLYAQFGFRTLQTRPHYYVNNDTAICGIISF